MYLRFSHLTYLVTPQTFINAGLVRYEPSNSSLIPLVAKIRLKSDSCCDCWNFDTRLRRKTALTSIRLPQFSKMQKKFTELISSQRRISRIAVIFFVRQNKGKLRMSCNSSPNFDSCRWTLTSVRTLDLIRDQVIDKCLSIQLRTKLLAHKKKHLRPLPRNYHCQGSIRKASYRNIN